MNRLLFSTLLIALIQSAASPRAIGQSTQSDEAALSTSGPRDSEFVGRHEGGRTVTPVNQIVTPHGKQIELTGLRPQVLALSPDGKRVLVSGKTSEVLALDTVTGEILQRVGLPSEKQNEPVPPQASSNILEPDKKGLASYTGLKYSPDGKWVVLSNVNGSIKPPTHWDSRWPTLRVARRKFQRASLLVKREDVSWCAVISATNFWNWTLRPEHYCGLFPLESLPRM